MTSIVIILDSQWNEKAIIFIDIQKRVHLKNKNKHYYKNTSSSLRSK